MLTTLADYLSPLMNYTFLEVPVYNWLASLFFVFVAVAAQYFFKKYWLVLTGRVSSRTRSEIDDFLFAALSTPLSWTVFVLGLGAAATYLSSAMPNVDLTGIIISFVRFLTILFGLWFLFRFIGLLQNHYGAKARSTDSTIDGQLVVFVAKVFKLFLILTGTLLLLQNLGYSISGLIASLGIGGIAVAMAAKDTIANVFGSVMILLDRPFKVGDWIKSSEFEGVVEEIGFRSTRIRTFAKTLVNVPNSSIANMVIDNIDARNVRRIKMRLGLTYSTTPTQMRDLITGIEAILTNHPGVDQTYKLVKFDELEDSSLSIFLYYFSASKVWEEYLQVRQEVNLLIMDLVEEMNLEFSFPTRTLYLEGIPDKNNL